LTETRHAARLQPLYSGLSEFNLQVTELVCGAPAHEDLCRIFASTVERFSAEKADELYAGEFPGIEAMLEEEFRKLQGGLSRADEFKLYGSFTAWALIIITAEIVLGGGFTLLDMILNTAVMPFIPKWITHFKILDVLKEIGERIDEAHRKALHKILGLQMQRYLDQIGAVTPAGVGVDEAAALEDALREELAGAAALKPA
jgi:hypothetical protein